jgi:hypothetical protein
MSDQAFGGIPEGTCVVRPSLAMTVASMLPIPDQQQGLQRAELYRGYHGA